MLCVGLIVAYCFANAPGPAPSGALFCQIAKPIRWSANDTRLTKEQADRQNRIGKALCNWK